MNIQPTVGTLTRRPALQIFAISGLVTLFAFVLAATLRADTSEAHDDFESNDFGGGYGWSGNWFTQGDVDIRSQEGPHQGSRHVRLRGDGLMAREVDVTGATDVRLRFWAKAKGLESADQAFATVSPDGVNVVILNTWTEADSDDTYRFYEFDLENAGVTPNDSIWVSFSVDFNQGNDHFFIDEVEVVTVEAATPTATPSPTSTSTPTLTPTSTPSPTPTLTPTATPSPTPTTTVTPFPTDTPTPTPTLTPTPTVVPTATPTATPTPTPSPTALPSPTLTLSILGDGPITVDSNFDDWSGHSFLLDPWNDHSGGDKYDLAALYWANNTNEQINFHMVQRQTTDGQPFDGSNGVSAEGDYILYVDVNNNGNYGDLADRVVRLNYSPRNHDSRVRVRVYRLEEVGDNDLELISDSNWDDWGETKGEGGLRFEFALTWDDLGFAFGQAMRMYLVSYDGNVKDPDVRDRLPDGNADIQWSPASILGPWLLAGAFALGIVVIWWFRGRHVWGRRPSLPDDGPTLQQQVEGR